VNKVVYNCPTYLPKHVVAQPISNFKCFTACGYNIITRNIEVKFALAMFNNIYIVRCKKLHKSRLTTKIIYIRNFLFRGGAW